MKKISRRNFLKVSGAMAAAGALAACGGSGASTPAASGAASTSTAASAAAAGEDKFASLGDFTMTVGHAQPEGNPRFVSMEQFAADVAEATNGHVKIEVYGNGQLGTEKEMLEQVVAGTVQGIATWHRRCALRPRARPAPSSSTCAMQAATASSPTPSMPSRLLQT